MHLAIHEGNGELAKLLIEAGADVQARTDADKTPVQVAASAGVPEVLTLLVAAGAPVNFTIRWETPTWTLPGRAATFPEQGGCPESPNR